MALCSQTASAQSFNSLWKQADQQQQKDLPRDQLATLDRIIAKAEQEGQSYGQLLKAESRRLAIMNELAPDSLKAEMDRLSARYHAGRYSHDEALQASYATLIGTAWSIRTDVNSSDAQDSAQVYFIQALKNPAALAAAKAGEYNPGVVDGSDSRSYQDDMLHVVGRYIDSQDEKINAYQLMHDYYETSGVRSAACYTAIKIAEREKLAKEKTRQLKKSAYVKALDSIGNAYRDLPECAEVVIARYNYMSSADDVSEKDKIELINYALTHWGSWPRMNYLRNEKSLITMPSYQITLEHTTMLPGHSEQVEITSLCNLSELTMKVYATSLTGNCDLSVNDKDDLKKIKAAMNPNPVQTVTRQFLGLPEYQHVSDTMSIAPLDAGVYLIEFSTSNEQVAQEYKLIHVSNITVLSQRMPGNQLRLAVLNATTGQPVKKASLQLIPRNNKKKETVNLKTDERGEALYTTRDWLDVYASTDDDKAMEPVYLNASYYYSSNTADQKRVSLFTDRAIYRPGQTVHCALVAYTLYHNDTPLSDEGREIKLVMRDANYKVVSEKTVRTDAYGKAAADFAIPTGLLTGRFRITADGASASTYFNVEEYKRPTFKVEMEMPTVAYQEGDTVRVKGRATTFSGVPVADANVDANISCYRPYWCLWSGNAGSTETTYSTKTDSAGGFEIKVVMETPATEHSRFASRYNLYHFLVVAKVTSMSGESRQQSVTIPLSDKDAFLQVEAPAQNEKSDSLRFCFTLTNSAGKAVEGTVAYTLAGTKGVAQTNQYVSIDASRLASGRHLLEGICNGDTVSTYVTLFSIDDRHAPYETHDWFYISSNEFPTDITEAVKVQYGSTDEKQHVLYSVFTEDQVLEQGTFDLNSQLRTIEYKYKEAYGDGITLTMAWQREGKAYCHSEQIAKPLPNKELKASWTSFRNRLTPGQKEKWTLHLADADGKPAAASMVAAMYDASLDQIRQHSMPFSLNMRRYLPNVSWRAPQNNGSTIYGEMSFSPLQETQLNFSHFCFEGTLYRNEFSSVLYGSSNRRLYAMASKQCSSAVATLDAAEMAVEESAVASTMALDVSGADESKANAATESDEDGATVSSSDASTRTNLSETAFFYPQLESNSQGNIDISFTLPESLTSWRLLALANDKEMRFAQLDETITAQKELMVQPNMPRFVRKGDKAVVASSVSNLSSKQLRGTATMELLDAETEKLLQRQQLPFTVDTARTTTLNFNIDPSTLEKTDLLICRITAKADTHTDGEQHYLPVMPEKELVTNTKAITQHAAGTVNIDLSQLFKVNDSSSRLTIEYTDHPAWLMVQTLPTVADVQSENAISLVSGLYANAIASNIISSSPEIKKTVALWKQTAADNSSTEQSPLSQNSELKELLLSETPWMMEAESETEQRQMLQTYLDESIISQRLSNYSEKLAKLQRLDGSFSWWKGMEGSRYITTAVATTLARQNLIVKLNSDETRMLNSAVNYLAKKTSEIVAEIKKEQKRTGKKPLTSYLSNTTLDYLYLTSIYDCALSDQHQADAEYLVDMATKATGEYSIFGKARLAQIFAHYGKKKLSDEYIESAYQYSVYSEEMGRYYDTHKANYSWRDYRIPTQVAAIEAMKALKQTDDTTIEQMQRWLLMEKRTQMWDTPINTVDAVHAFLEGNMQSLGSSNDEKATFTLDGKALTMQGATPAIGYVKASMSGKNARKLTINKTTDHTSWGAVYAQFMQTTSEISSSDEGIKVARRFLVNGKAVASDNGAIALKVGDRVKVEITITASRDYDFVEIIDKRAACLEPVSQLSGYRGGLYIAPRDNQTVYYADRMSKGTHFIETEYFVDRAGSYSTGTCTAQCAYSPEYSGRASALKLNVSEK